MTTETVHACPPEGSGLTPCCGRTPFELPLTDRISSEAPVTCTGAASAFEDALLEQASPKAASKPAADPTERRDRYKAAIRENDGWVLDDGQHMLDAVMAVADAEQAELRGRLARVREWVTSDVVTASSGFGDGYREAQRDIRDLIGEVQQPPAAAPAVDRAALRDRIADESTARYDSATAAGQNLSFAPPPAAWAAVLRWAADELDARMERFFREWPDEPRNSPYVLGQKDAAAELRRLADETPDTEAARDCPACDAGIGHSEHCPTPETHNWGCGCPTDQAPAAGARQGGATP